jgi:hypothetical protein
MMGADEIGKTYQAGAGRSERLPQRAATGGTQKWVGQPNGRPQSGIMMNAFTPGGQPRPQVTAPGNLSLPQSPLFCVGLKIRPSPAEIHFAPPRLAPRSK